MKIRNRYRAMGFEMKVERPDIVLVNGKEEDGSWDENTLTMELRKDLDPQRELLQFFHEVTHICDPHDVMNEDQRHDFTRNLVCFLLDNNMLRD